VSGWSLVGHLHGKARELVVERSAKVVKKNDREIVDQFLSNK